MTLNITLVTETRIYQSSDFKLTIPTTGETVSTTSTKLVQLQYPSFDGFLTYTGIGRWPYKHSRDTSERVLEWLNGGNDITFDELIERVRLKGDRFLRRIASRIGIPRHTFTIAAFVNGIPAVALVSNFESVDGSTRSSPELTLSVTRRAYRGDTFVVITGNRPAVHRERRKQLERMGRQLDASPNRIRELLSRVNAAAAKSDKSNDTISEDCSVFSIDASGAGFQELTPGARIEPRQISNGVALPNLGPFLTQIGLGPSPILVGTSFVTSKAEPGPYPPCNPSIVNEHGSYQVIDISVPDMAESRPLSLREFDELTIAGVSSPSENRGDYRYWTWSASRGHEMLDLHVANGSGMFFLPDRSAVLTLSVDDHLGVCRVGNGDIDIFDQAERLDASCTASNESALIGGWVGGLDAKNRGQESWRPAIWSGDGSVQILPEDALLGASWAYVVDLNDNNIALVCAYRDHRATPLLWNIRNDDVSFVADGSEAVPVALDNDGTVLGFKNDSKGQSVAALCSQGQTWQPLGTEAGWTPLAMNSHKVIAGRTRRNGFLSTAILINGQDIQLPAYHYHNAQATRISNANAVIGFASADHGSHAILWLPS